MLDSRADPPALADRDPDARAGTPAPTTATVDPTTLFNGYIGSHVVFALRELGVWERLASSPASATTLCTLGADPALFGALINSAEVLGYVQLQDGVVSLTPAGQAVVRNLGFFTWAVGGCGGLLRAMSELTAGRAQWGNGVQRDGGLVADGAAEVGRALMTPVETALLARVDYSSVADIGCGDGSRLIRLCQGAPPRRGLGIDISEAACGLATRRVSDVGLSDHIDIVCRNIFEPDSRSAFSGIDLVSSFLMLHDLFAQCADGTAVIHALRSAFPDARYFLLADTMAQSWHSHDGPLPMFSLGFELVHAFMGVPIQRKETYERAFIDGGLHIERCEPLGVPATWLYLLRTPGSQAAP